MIFLRLSSSLGFEGNSLLKARMCKVKNRYFQFAYRKFFTSFDLMRIKKSMGKLLCSWLLKLIPKAYSEQLQRYVFLKKTVDKYPYNRATNKVKVTLFGPCHQDSINPNFQLTKMPIGISYRNSTKEIIQAIKYLSAVGHSIPKNQLDSTNSQSKKPMKKLNNQFNDTHIFVVEISSRVTYESEAEYFSSLIHELLSETELNHKYQAISRLQQDQEVIEDMIEIYKLLSPKPVVFVTGFCAGHSNDDSILRDLVVSQSKKLNCQYLDPSDLLKNYKLEVLATKSLTGLNLSKFGLKLLEGRYQLLLLKALFDSDCNQGERYLTQVLVSSEDRVKKFTAHGLGDSAQGLAYLYRYAIAHGRVPNVDSTRYFTRGYMKESSDNFRICETFESVFHNDKDDKFIDHEFVFTNKKWIAAWDERMRDFLLTSLFTPTEQFTKIFSHIKTSLKIISEYEVIHIRLGDEYFTTSGSILTHKQAGVDEFLNQLKGEYSDFGRYLVMSDSQYVNERAKEFGYIVREGGVSHSGLGSLSESERIGILADFFLMSECTKIHQISSYSWGSNFSETASLVFNKPLAKNSRMSHAIRSSLA